MGIRPTSTPSRQRGSAITETLIGLMVLVPAFWAVDHLGRLANIQRDTVMGARHTAWEALAQPDARGVTGPRLDHELRDRIHGSVHAPVISADRLAREGYSQDVMRRPGKQPLLAERAAGRIGAQRERGNPPLRLLLPSVAEPILARGKAIPSAVRLVGLSGQMLGLPRAPLVTYQHSVPLAREAIGQSPNADTPPPAITATAGLLTEGWNARSDRDYQRRTERIVAGEPVHAFTSPARFLGRLTFFKEGRHARADNLVPPSRVQPR